MSMNHMIRIYEQYIKTREIIQIQITIEIAILICLASTAAELRLQFASKCTTYIQSKSSGGVTRTSLKMSQNKMIKEKRSLK